jgi:hypothetical protein
LFTVLFRSRSRERFLPAGKERREEIGVFLNVFPLQVPEEAAKIQAAVEGKDLVIVG